MALLVGDHESPQMIREASFQASHGFVAGLVFGNLGVEVVASDAVAHADLGAALPGDVIAELSRRSPPRDSRWRFWSPLATSIGATPV